MKIVSKIISNLIFAFLIVAVLALAVPRAFGIQLYSVLSGSMEPAYSTGDLIYAVPTDEDKLEVGDVISFLLNSQGTVATHRITEIDQGNRCVYTKGDANDVDDGSAVKFENVIGVVRFSIPVVGYLIGYMNTPSGRIITITILAALILLVILLQRVGEDEEEEEFRKQQASSKERRENRRQYEQQIKLAQEQRQKQYEEQKRQLEEEIRLLHQEKQQKISESQVNDSTQVAFTPPVQEKQSPLWTAKAPVQPMPPTKYADGLTIHDALLRCHNGVWYYSHSRRYRIKYPNADATLKALEKGGSFQWDIKMNATDTYAASL